MLCPPLHTSVDYLGPNVMTTQDLVFHSLDHQRIDGDHNSWMISVVGVHVDAFAIWVQIAKDDCTDDTVIVQMQRDTDPADVVASLKGAASGARLVVVPALRSSH